MGVTAIKREGGKEVYQLAFSFMGVQCRETITRPHGKASLTYCVNLRGEILRRIEAGTFQYNEYFPTSKRASIFGHGHGKSHTIREALEAYRDRTKHTLEASTWNPYRRDIDNILIPRWGHMRITAFTPADLRAWAGEQTISLKRMRNILLPLRAVFSEAKEDGIIRVHPLDIDLAKLVPIAKRKSDYVPQPYTVAELRTVLANIPTPERWAFQLWAYTGLRTGELIGLRWPRVNLDANTLTVSETTTERVDKPRANQKRATPTPCLHSGRRQRPAIHYPGWPRELSALRAGCAERLPHDDKCAAGKCVQVVPARLVCPLHPTHPTKELNDGMATD